MRAINCPPVRQSLDARLMSADDRQTRPRQQACSGLVSARNLISPGVEPSPRGACAFAMRLNAPSGSAGWSQHGARCQGHNVTITESALYRTARGNISPGFGTASRPLP